MEKIVCRFRTALGGFHREDVLNYITKTAQTHAREVEELNRRLERELEERQELEGQLDGLRDEQGSAAEEEARVRASLEEATLALAQVREELAQAEQELAQAEQELAGVRAELAGQREQVAQLEPLAQKYEELKDRVATVELDAHRQAQAIVDEAQAQADGLREDARAWLRGVVGHYDGLRREVDEMSGHTQAMCRMLKQVQAADEQLAALKERGGVE